ncbi:MAG: hypothetical protein ACI82H_000631 [Alphaproteobacteria bacterium]
MSAGAIPGDDGRFRAAIAAIDAVNAGDPSTEPDGALTAPSALLYGRRMSAWLLRLAPEAPEELRLAARAQHIGRWKIPRDSYPEGRDGYLAWRVALARFHAETAGDILAGAGYGLECITRVGDLLQKKQLKRDGDVQTLEDVACLVFLETQFPGFAAKHPDEKVVDILQKTAAKMSAQGLAEAVRLVEHLPEKSRELIARALG